jgi:DNA-binding NarL/FixJ family response regulator
MTAKTSKAKVFLVDDHASFREALAEVIDHQEDLAVSGTADDAHRALQAIEAAKPDIAVIDICLAGKTGIELIKDLRVRCPNLPILVLSMYQESLYAEHALWAGAKGYVMKEESIQNVLVAIRRVLAGAVYVSEKMAARVLKEVAAGRPGEFVSPLERLSDRELEVFRLIGQGYRSHQIADKLHLSEKTIEAYRANIREKMNLKDATELLQQAIRWAQSTGGG